MQNVFNFLNYFYFSFFFFFNWLLETITKLTMLLVNLLKNLELKGKVVWCGTSLHGLISVEFH